jgi:hypothetical protein
MSERTITEQDVVSFQDKLDAWATTLTEPEVAILQMVAVRAFPESVRGADHDVEGYAAGGFEIDDYSFDIEQVLNIGSSSTGAGAGKVTFNPFSITRKTDSSSPKLFRSADLGSFVGVGIGK